MVIKLEFYATSGIAGLRSSTIKALPYLRNIEGKHAKNAEMYKYEDM